MSAAKITGVNPEPEAFIPLVHRLDLTDPVTAPKTVAEGAAAAPVPDTVSMSISGRMVPADPDVVMSVGDRRTPGHRFPAGQAVELGNDDPGRIEGEES